MYFINERTKLLTVYGMEYPGLPYGEALNFSSACAYTVPKN